MKATAGETDVELLTAAQMSALDRRTIEEVGLPGAVLMENAGRGAARAILARWGRAPRRLAVISGPGNNGGDGFVVARLMRAAGWDPRVALLAERARVRGEAEVHLRAWLGSGGEVAEIADVEALAGWGRAQGPFGLVVDAVLGTGLEEAPRGRAADAIAWIGEAGAPVVSLDVPSGLDASTGRTPGACVRADLTVTFAFAKRGHALPPGARCCGDVEVVDIGIPVSLLSDEHRRVRWVERPDPPPPRDPESHKGTHGHLLLVGGSTGKTGAIGLAARGALRAGAGLASVAAPASLLPVVAGHAAEAMTVPVEDRGHGFLVRASAGAVLAALEGKHAAVLGPGLGLDPETGALARDLVARVPVPLVVDADALTALGRERGPLVEAPAPRVLTPHPGEMARLVGGSPADVQADRLGSALALAAASGAVVVLKGAGTVVAAPDGRATISSTGNPGMATGGMGDVLAGVLGALLAGGGDPFTASTLGVHLHGAAGDRLARRAIDVGLLASELADEIPAALADVVAGVRGGGRARIRRAPSP